MLAWVLASGLAPGPAVDIDWSAPETCPTREALLEELDAYLDHESAGSSDRVDQVQARIEQSESGWKLHLRAQVEGGVLERTLEADRCELLGKAAALMISVLVHPTAVVESIEKAKTTQPKPAPEPEFDPQPQLQAQVESEREPSPWLPSLRVGLSGGAALGTFPGPAGQLQLQFGLVFRHLRAEIMAVYTTPTEVLYSDAELEAAQIDPSENPGVGASVQSWSAGGRLCGTPRAQRWRFVLCAGGEAGKYLANGVGLNDPRRATPNALRLSAGAGAEFALTSQLLLNLSGDAIVPILRPSFSVGDVGALHTVGAIGGRVSLGFAAEFGFGGARK